MSFKSSFGALENAGGSWLGFGILILILIWSLVFDLPMIQFFALYLDFEGSFKSSFVALKDTGGSWLGFGILILFWIWSMVFDAPMILILALSWLWRWKEHPCPLSPDLGLWKVLEAPDWGLGSIYWFRYGHWSLIYQRSKFWLSILILKVQRTSMSFKSSFGALEDAGGSWLEFVILIFDWIWIFD